MKYLGPSLHNSPPPAALQTPRSMTPHKHFKDKEDMGTAKGAEREKPHGLSFLAGWPGPPTLGSGTHSYPQVGEHAKGNSTVSAVTLSPMVWFQTPCAG